MWEKGEGAQSFPHHLATPRFPAAQVGAATFSISAESYETVDAGATYARRQPPLSYTYFLGSQPAAAAAEPAESQGLTFNARALLAPGLPGSAALLAGAVAQFYPAVEDSFVGLGVTGITAGVQGVLRQDYLVGSPVARRERKGCRLHLFRAHTNVSLPAVCCLLLPLLPCQR